MLDNHMFLLCMLAGIIDYIIYIGYQKNYIYVEHLKPADSSYGLNVRLLSYFKIAVYYVYNILLAAVDILCMYSFLINNSYTMYILLLVIMLAGFKYSAFDVYTVTASTAYHISMSVTVNILVRLILENCSLTRIEKYSSDISREISCIIMVRILIVILVDVYDKYIGIKLGRLAGTAIAVTSLGITVACIMVSKMAYKYVDTRPIVLSVLIILWCITNIIAMLINMIEQNSRHSYEIIMLERERQTNREIYDNIKSGQEELRDIRHDIKNRLSSLRSVIVQNDSSAALDYLDGMIGSVDMVKGKIYCNNLVINNILTYKLSGVADNISVECEAEVPEQISVDMGDLGVIIGNLLDNSIKAVNNINTGGYIHIIITESIGKLIIIIENNYLKDTEKKPAIYYIDHGRGINNVRRIVKKCGGSYKENVSENVYQTKISI